MTGEAMPVGLSRECVRRYPGVGIINAYGPTECSDDVTHYEVREGGEEEARSVPIGRALQNTRLYVVDKELKVVAEGVYGELIVGGEGVGRGYMNEGGQTGEVYVPDEYGGEEGGRVYRTGDMVRYEEGGELEFGGRVDEQVKVRGYRIELGEVEGVLREHEGVREAVVVLRGESSGEQRLVAYVVGSKVEGIREVELRDHVKERLPDYMVPAVFDDARRVAADGEWEIG